MVFSSRLSDRIRSCSAEGKAAQWRWPTMERPSWKPLASTTRPPKFWLVSEIESRWFFWLAAVKSWVKLGSFRNKTFLYLSDMSKVQDDEVGDGTTSVTVLAAELLRVKWFFNVLSGPAHCSFVTNALSLQEAELLIAKKIHPQTIISGWRKATQVARDALREAAVDHRWDWQLTL